MHIRRGRVYAQLYAQRLAALQLVFKFFFGNYFNCAASDFFYDCFIQLLLPVVNRLLAGCKAFLDFFLKRTFKNRPLLYKRGHYLAGQ